MAFAATGSQRLWGTILPGNGMHWLAEHARKSRILELEWKIVYPGTLPRDDGRPRIRFRPRDRSLSWFRRLASRYQLKRFGAWNNVETDIERCSQKHRGER